MTDSRAAHAHPPAYSVDIQGVSQHFMQGDTRIDVLKNIDLKVRYGEVVAILGPSGSGKSTLLNILGLLSTPASGSYLLGTVQTPQPSTRHSELKRAWTTSVSSSKRSTSSSIRTCTATLSYRSSTVACPKRNEHNGLKTLSPCWG